MKKYALLILWSFMMNVHGNTIWDCQIKDEAGVQWNIRNPYRLKSLTLALDACRKESQNPLSCHKKNIQCEAFVNGISTTPLWKCRAMDANAVSFTGRIVLNRDEAAF